MNWIDRYLIRHYLTNSLWILPLLGMAAAMASVRLVHAIDMRSGAESAIRPETGLAALGALSTSMFTFVVFVSSALLVAVQLASAQLSPRIIGIVFNDPVTKCSLTLFVFSFTFSLSALVRIEGSVPPLTILAAAYGGIASLAVFLYLIDHVGRALRPSGALRAVGKAGREVIRAVYPRRLQERAAEAVVSDPLPAPDRIILSRKDGVVRAFDVRGLVQKAVRADCVVELAPQVGDFVAEGDPLFRIYRGGDKLTEAELAGSISVGQERTFEQDPAFAFRVLVDIAAKGLSPAINDPTTAVLALDQIHHLLRSVGSRALDDERVRDVRGQVRLLFRTPDWGEFVHLAVTEIRQFGGGSIQVARRLKAMLENLIATLPHGRTILLRGELELLGRSADRFFIEPEDRALAEIADLQGVGGVQDRDAGRGRPAGATP
ncbi:MAG TPA: DUF2254 domain-containing protein [Planctomycetia bacterium]|nr:DUF2254 domain-containing protein [Planctomycetia bacterium]